MFTLTGISDEKVSGIVRVWFSVLKPLSHSDRSNSRGIVCNSITLQTCSITTYVSFLQSSSSCVSSYCTKVMSCKGYNDIKSGYESYLAEATASVGPIR